MNPREGRLMCRDDRGEIRLATLRGRDGSETERLFVIHGGSVVMVPVTRSGELILIQNRRPGVGETLWELCAGTLEPDEEPELGAVRELREETGYRSARVERLAGFYPTNGISKHYGHALVAHDCVFEGAQQLDPAERMTARTFTRDEVRELLHSGAIEDAFTALALFYYFR